MPPVSEVVRLASYELHKSADSVIGPTQFQSNPADRIGYLLNLWLQHLRSPGVAQCLIKVSARLGYQVRGIVQRERVIGAHFHNAPVSFQGLVLLSGKFQQRREIPEDRGIARQQLPCISSHIESSLVIALPVPRFTQPKIDTGGSLRGRVGADQGVDGIDQRISANNSAMHIKSG